MDSHTEKKNYIQGVYRKNSMGRSYLYCPNVSGGLSVIPLECIGFSIPNGQFVELTGYQKDKKWIVRQASLFSFPRRNI